MTARPPCEQGDIGSGSKAALDCSMKVPVRKEPIIHKSGPDWLSLIQGSVMGDGRMTTPLNIGHTPEEADLQALGERAKALKQRLGRLAAPLIVEFSGSPKSGKTTNIDIVDHFFRRSGFKVWAPTEGASKRTPYHLRKDLVAFNAWSLNYAISELLLSYHNIDPMHLVILDRGPFDSLAWMGVLKQRGKLTPSEYDIIRDFALHPKWAKLLTRIYLFTCYPRTSLDRETN